MEENQRDLDSLRRIQKGEERALAEIIDRYQGTLISFAYRYTQNIEDAREIVLETFVRVHSSASKFRPRAKVRTWIFAIAANLCRDWWRRQRRVPPHLNLDSPPSPSSDSAAPMSEYLADPKSTNPALELEREEIFRAIDRAIASLPHKLRFPFLYCVIEKNTAQDCAQILGTSLKTVETRIYRARQKLRNLLKPWAN